MAIRAKLTRILKGNSLRTVVRLIAKGDSMAEKPITSAMLAILEPITLEMAIEPDPFMAAEILTANSGALVPKATTVNPIKSGETPKLDERPEAPSTSQSAPFTSNAMPMIKKTNCQIICYATLLCCGASSASPFLTKSIINSAAKKARTENLIMDGY